MQAESRSSFRLSDMLAAHGLTAGRFGVLVESVGEALPRVVERAMYRSEGGQQFRVGTTALGTLLP